MWQPVYHFLGVLVYINKYRYTNTLEQMKDTKIFTLVNLGETRIAFLQDKGGGACTCGGYTDYLTDERRHLMCAQQPSKRRTIGHTRWTIKRPLVRHDEIKGRKVKKRAALFRHVHPVRAHFARLVHTHTSHSSASSLLAAK